MIKAKIKIEMLESSIIITFPKNMEEFNLYRKKKYKDTEDYTDAEGVVVSGIPGETYIVLSQDKLSHNLIGHELHHLTEKIARECMILEEETKAWISGYVAEHIYKTIIKKKLKLHE